MAWRTTTLSTDPASLDVATTETVTLAYDVTRDLETGENVTSATTRLIRLDTLATVTIDAAPAVATNVVTQLIDGSDLARGVDYELTWSAHISATKVLSRTTVLQVVA
jgi:hypothetical protein